MTEDQSSKIKPEVINTLSKLYRPIWVPPKPPVRKTIDVVDGVKVRSMYDGELNDERIEAALNASQTERK